MDNRLKDIIKQSLTKYKNDRTVQEMVLLCSLTERLDELDQAMAEMEGYEWVEDDHKEFWELLTSTKDDEIAYRGPNFGLRLTEHENKALVAIYALSADLGLLTSKLQWHTNRLWDLSYSDEKKRLLAEAAQKVNDPNFDLVLEMRDLDKRYQDKKQKLLSMSEHTDKALTYIEDVAEGRVEKGIKLNHFGLDKKIGGLKRDTLTVIAARPSMGKTAYALHCLYQIIMQEKNCVFFSLEMTARQLILRLFSMHGKIDASRFEIGDLDNDQNDRLAATARELFKIGHNNLIDDACRTIEDIERFLTRAKVQLGQIDCVFVDYLQLVKSTKKAFNAEQEIAQVSLKLKELSKEFNCSVVALAQINRGSEQKNADKFPNMADIKGSGQIEQDADLVLILHREDYYKPNTERPNVLDVKVAKNRSGDTGVESYYFQRNIMSFTEIKGEE